MSRLGDIEERITRAEARWKNLSIIGPGWAGDSAQGFTFNPREGGGVTTAPIGPCTPVRIVFGGVNFCTFACISRIDPSAEPASFDMFSMINFNGNPLTTTVFDIGNDLCLHEITASSSGPLGVWGSWNGVEYEQSTDCSLTPILPGPPPTFDPAVPVSSSSSGVLFFNRVTATWFLDVSAFGVVFSGTATGRVSPVVIHNDYIACGQSETVHAVGLPTPSLSPVALIPPQPTWSYGGTATITF